MSASQIGSTRTVVQIATEALGDTINTSNWAGNGPDAFDDMVYEAADRVRHTLTSEEEELVAQAPDDMPWYRTLNALRSQPGGRDLITASIIVAMRQQAPAYHQAVPKA